MDSTRLSDVDLLRKVIGVRETRRLYQGKLGPLFSSLVAEGRSEQRCMAAAELVKRWLSEDLRRGPAFNSPGKAKEYLALHFANREREAFLCLFLDAQNRLIEAEELFAGTLTQTSVYPREIVKRALHHNAAAVMFAHNHPSGVAEPSRADELLTQSLKNALSTVDVKVLDHFVIGAAAVMSFAERGLL